MKSIASLKLEIEEIRNLLNEIIADMVVNDCNYDELLDISTKMDKLILEYIKNEG